MNRKKLIYILLVAGAAVAFIFDRLVLSDPSEASAESLSTSKAREKKSRAKQITQAVSDAEYDPSSRYLDKLPETHLTRDVFIPTPIMRRYLDQLQQQAQAQARLKADQEAGNLPGSPSEFQSNNELQATSISQGMEMAVINGKFYRIGDVIDGYRIMRIGAYKVDLQNDSDQVTLTLPVPVK